jgi:hypothetical protein
VASYGSGAIQRRKGAASIFVDPRLHVPASVILDLITVGR